MWLLTREHNEYNQHGEYFVEMFHAKPTVRQLQAADDRISEKEAEHILEHGGGRLSRFDDMWWNLTKHKPVSADERTS